MRDKLVAAGIHLAVSLIVAALILVLLFVIWFPSPLMQLGAVQGVQLILLVDLAIGPLLTLIVFKKGKSTLVLDLCVIVALQIGALAYGLNAVYGQTPSFLVLTYEGIYVVSRYEESRSLTEAQIDQLENLRQDTAKYAGKIPVFLLSEPENTMLRSAQNNGFMFNQSLAYYLNTSEYESFQGFDHLVQEGTASIRQLESGDTCIEVSLISAHGETTTCLKTRDNELIKT